MVVYSSPDFSNRRQMSDNVVGLIIAALIAGGLLFLFKQSPSINAPLKLKHYKNEETWTMKWSDDGSECEVRIHRDATQG